MRGTKLTAWRIPPLWKNLQGNVLDIPENSNVLQKQEILQRATAEVLAEIAKDMREGLLETVGVESWLSMDGTRCSIVLELAPETDTKLIAQAIDLENVEAWCDQEGRVNIAVNPWYSTKDVDQSVLCAIKVVHVLLGLHAVCEVKPKTFRQKILASVIEIMQAQQKASKK